ncbi:MAG TPA: hypothetical protein VEH84_15655 [Alphaproteobacteria bacterium]|nr:hypothetical protein [Alphaproteobacteria bacterium]
MAGPEEKSDAEGHDREKRTGAGEAPAPGGTGNVGGGVADAARKPALDPDAAGTEGTDPDTVTSEPPGRRG